VSATPRGAPVEGGPAVVGVGGGHGLAVTLSAARRYAGSVGAVVSVADDGGSSGRLRHALGVPAPGDVRRCLVALASAPEPWPSAFERRFDASAGELAGHPLGNLILAGLTVTTGDFVAAIEEAGRLLGAVGRVLPASSGPVVLRAVVDDGVIEGQAAIAAAGRVIRSVSTTGPQASLAVPDEVVGLLVAADQIVLGPGSLYTSVCAALAVPGLRSALAACRERVVFVANLRPSKEAIGLDLADHVAAVRAHGLDPGVVLSDPAGLERGDQARLAAALGPARLVEADLARPNGWSHDVSKLADALAGLAR